MKTTYIKASATHIMSKKKKYSIINKNNSNAINDPICKYWI